MEYESPPDDVTSDHSSGGGDGFAEGETYGWKEDDHDKWLKERFLEEYTSPLRFKHGTPVDAYSAKCAYHSGLKEIRRQQRSTHAVFPYLPFTGMVRQIGQDVCYSSGSVNFDPGAFLVLRNAAEDYLVKLLQDANLNAIADGSTAVQPKHIQCARRNKRFCSDSSAPEGTLEAISKQQINALAACAGVLLLSELAYEEIKRVLPCYLINLLRTAIAFSEYHYGSYHQVQSGARSVQSQVVTTCDVLTALQHSTTTGKTLLGTGCLAELYTNRSYVGNPGLTAEQITLAEAERVAESTHGDCDR